ncbi:MAG: TonB-dependent receptor [Proteobacteria bacterium]|nr:TonB-dependent receptor [Pseudomonadota bacterium]
MPALAQAASGTGAADVAEASELVVTGTRIQTTGVEQPTPVTVLGQDLIKQIGATQLSDVVNNLPAFRATQSSQTQFVGGGGNIAGANLIDLRGLGPVRTLVLIDGLRYPASNATESTNSDLIPASLISRIDVVTGGASAAYGSDAVAGVVNIVLDHKLEGFRGAVQYGVTQEGDGQDQLYSVAGGHAFMDGRFHVIAGADYEDRQAVPNCYSRSWCSQEYGVATNPTPGANGLPAFVIAPGVRASQNTPASLIVSSKLIVAFGGQQVSADGKSLAPFTFGQLYAPNSNQMIGGSMPGVNGFADAFNLRAPSKRYALYAHGEGDLTQDIQGFVDISYGEVKTDGHLAQLRGGNQNAAGAAPAGPVNSAATAIANTNPFLPAQLLAEMNQLGLTSVDIGKSGDAFPLPTSFVDSTTYRVAAGVKGQVFGWKWDASYLHGETTQSFTEINDLNQANYALAVQAVNGTGANAGQIVCAVNKTTTTVPGCAPLNLFGVGTASPAALAYAFGTAYSDTKDKLDDVSANIQGQPFSLWAGPVSVATGLEYRQETLLTTTDPLSATGAFVQNTAALQGKSRVLEAYGETTVPLLKDMTWAKELNFNAAFRRTQYNLSSGKAPVGGTAVGAAESEFNASTWKMGLVYRPIDWLRFRGTISKDFRAPNLSELYVLPTVANSAVLDPLTHAQVQVPTQSGGNPNLKPEIAFTTTAGFTVQAPDGPLHNLQLSVDYYNIKVKGYIASVGATTLVNECLAGAQDACALVTRNAQNVLTLVKNVSANANQIEETGTDIEVDYKQPLGDIGDLNFRILATVYSKLNYINAGVPTDGHCQNGFVTQQAYPSMPCYVINGLATFTRGPWLAGVQLNYIPEGKYGNGFVGPQDAGYSPTLVNSVSNNRVAARTYVNLNGSYKFPDHDGRTLEVFGVVNNLFNQDPPVAPANNIGANALLYDVVGRVYRMGVRFRY